MLLLLIVFANTLAIINTPWTFSDSKLYRTKGTWYKLSWLPSKYLYVYERYEILLCVVKDKYCPDRKQSTLVLFCWDRSGSARVHTCTPRDTAEGDSPWDLSLYFIIMFSTHGSCGLFAKTFASENFSKNYTSTWSIGRFTSHYCFELKQNYYCYVTICIQRTITYTIWISILNTIKKTK